MTQGWVDVDFYTADVERMLARMNVQLSPVALASFFMGGMVEEYIQERIEDRFAGEGDNTVGQWAPLSAATQSIRVSQGYGGAHPINVRTGELERFILNSGNATPEAYGASFSVPGTAPQGELATKLEHAQGGGTSDSGKQFPARPVIGLGVEDLTSVLVLLSQYLEAGP